MLSTDSRTSILRSAPFQAGPAAAHESGAPKPAVSAVRPPLFSLVLATYGRAEVLRPMLASLTAQTCRDMELIVVDQNRDERVTPYLEPIRAAGIPLRHLRAERPNLSEARNLGITAAQGLIVCFPDDDCWYEPECLAKVAAAAAADPQADGFVVRWVESQPQSEPHTLEAGRFRRFRSGDASSISLFLMVKAVREVGSFDARIGVGRYYGAGEETDLMIRLLDAGKRIRHLPSAHVHHHLPPPGPALTRRALDAVRSRARGVGALYSKHQLGLGVVARGLIAPLVSGVLSRRPIAGAAFGAATALGRIEGMMGWRRTERGTGPGEQS